MKTIDRTNGDTATAATAATADSGGAIQIQRIGTETLLVPIVGTTPLIVSRFTEKAKRQILDKEQGRSTPREHRDPDAEYLAALYRLDDGGFGLPAVAFKACTVGAARFYKGVTMTDLRQMLFVKGVRSKQEGQQLVPIEGDAPVMREDIVRLAGQGRTADLRYRPEFTDWHATLEVIYVTGAISRGSVLSLINAGGFGVGVGEWRPERKGEFGTFEIADESRVQVISGG